VVGTAERSAASRALYHHMRNATAASIFIDAAPFLRQVPHTEAARVLVRNLELNLFMCASRFWQDACPLRQYHVRTRMRPSSWFPGLDHAVQGCRPAHFCLGRSCCQRLTRSSSGSLAMLAASVARCPRRCVIDVVRAGTLKPRSAQCFDQIAGVVPVVSCAGKVAFRAHRDQQELPLLDSLPVCSHASPPLRQLG
jgi:hypothetical protein